MKYAIQTAVYAIMMVYKRRGECMGRYQTYSEFLKKKYGEKVYKLPVALPVTCPNRDGTLACGGCTFCGEIGAGYENLPDSLPITEQLDRNIAHIGPKYKAKKFIAYFQNFTNTYAPVERFASWTDEACRHESVVGLDVSTRPDCIHEAYLDILKSASETYGTDITVELGLQSSNPHTLKKISRHHTAAEFIDASLRTGRYGFALCAHVIADLPWDDMTDVIETAKLVSVLPVTQVKIHSLYIVKGTEMARQYEEGKLKLLSMEEYVDRAVTFIEYLRPDIVLQRLVGRAPEENTLSVNWGRAWWVVRDHIEEEFIRRDAWQGDRCTYMDGSAVRKFVEMGE